jgi:DNA-binding XRE family transcriptional regulator
MDEAIDRGIVKNDSELARKLGITRQSVSAWRTGETYPDTDQAAALADLIGKPEIMAECMAARAKRPETRAIWERAARTLSMTAGLCAVVGVSLMAAPSPADASIDASHSTGICIM